MRNYLLYLYVYTSVNLLTDGKIDFLPSYIDLCIFFMQDSMGLYIMYNNTASLSTLIMHLSRARSTENNFKFNIVKYLVACALLHVLQHNNINTL